MTPSWFMSRTFRWACESARSSVMPARDRVRPRATSARVNSKPFGRRSAARNSPPLKGSTAGVPSASIRPSTRSRARRVSRSISSSIGAMIGSSTREHVLVNTWKWVAPGAVSSPIPIFRSASRCGALDRASRIIWVVPLPAAISPGHWTSRTKRVPSSRTSPKKPSCTTAAATASQWPCVLGELNWHGQPTAQLQLLHSTPRMRQRSAIVASLLAEQRLRRFQHLLGMLLGARDARPVTEHLAVLADQHRRADHARRLLAIHHLLSEGAVAGHHLAVGVGEQREGEFVLRDELLVRFRAVGAHAEHGDAELLERGQVVAEATGLLGAAGRVVPRIEVEQHVLLAGEVGERHGLAVLVAQRERRRRLAFLDRHGFSLGRQPIIREPVCRFAASQISRAPSSLVSVASSCCTGTSTTVR